MRKSNLYKMYGIILRNYQKRIQNIYKMYHFYIQISYREGVDRWCFTRNFSVSFSTTSLTNSVPLSVCRCVKHPNQQIIFWYKKLNILKALASVIALASCHLDRYSTATIMY